MDLSASAPIFTLLPGSDQASSVAVAGDTIYFTVDGDSRVFRLTSLTNVSVVHDFGGLIARDVQVLPGRLVAVVGGNVSYTMDPTLGTMVQRDGGGPLHLVNLQTGGDVQFTPDTLLFRHPALSPSGDNLIAELVTDTTTDLWMVSVP